MGVDMDRRSWYIDKGINPAYVVPLVSAILAGLVWAGSINSGQGVQDNRLVAVEKTVDEIKKDSREDFQKINDKLDRLIEGQKRMR